MVFASLVLMFMKQFLEKLLISFKIISNSDLCICSKTSVFIIKSKFPDGLRLYISTAGSYFKNSNLKLDDEKKSFKLSISFLLPHPKSNIRKILSRLFSISINFIIIRDNSCSRIWDDDPNFLSSLCSNLYSLIHLVLLLSYFVINYNLY